MAKNALPARWRALKSQKANLALFFIGIALAALAPGWRFAVAPAIKVVATDTDRISFQAGTLATYVAPPGAPAPGAEPRRTAVILQKRYYNPVGRSTGRAAVLEVDSQLIDAADKTRLSESVHTYAIDRRTAVQLPGHGSDMDRAGYYFHFPFNTPASDIEVWDDLSESARTASFAGAREAYGVRSYSFVVKYAGQPVPAPAGFPTRLTGAGLRALVPSLAHPVGDNDVFDISYRGNLSTEFLVEPVSGTEVGIPGTEESVYMTVEDRSRGLSFTRVVFKLDCAEEADSLREGGSRAKDEIAKIELQFKWLPLAYLVLGACCVAIGLFAGTGGGASDDSADAPGREGG